MIAVAIATEFKYAEGEFTEKEFGFNIEQVNNGKFESKDLKELV